MRELSAADFSGRVTFITGPEKHCGKTTLLNRALGLLREAGEAPMFLSVGFDGEARDSLTAARKPRIRAEAGELFVTAERYLKNSPVLPEVLELLPGSSALGRLALARARRSGEVVLVGPERNDYAAWIIRRAREESWTRTAVVDGAINRITQVSAFRGARFLFALRAGPAELEKTARKARLLAALARLPAIAPALPVGGLGDGGLPVGDLAEGRIEAAAAALGLPAPVHRLEGPLTPETAKRLPSGAATVLVDDFTKIFLDESGLASLRKSRALAVLEPFEFGGFVLALRGLAHQRFIDALGDSVPAEWFIRNPYEREGADAAA